MASSFTKHPPTVALCDNPMKFEFTTDLDPASENVNVILSPKYTGASAALGSEIIYPAAVGSADAFLGEYLRYGFYIGRISRRLFTYPDSSAGFTTWAALCKKYEVNAAVGAGYDPPVYFNILLENLYVMRGKVPEWIYDSFYNSNTNFWSWLVANKSFLTFAPLSVPTTISQLQKLYFLVYYAPVAGAKLKIKVTCTFTDGSTGTFTTAKETEAIAQYTVYEFHTSWYALGIEAWRKANYPDKTVYSYQVEVIDNATIVSEARQYILDYLPHLAEHQFIFANNAGAYDTLLTTGLSLTENEFEVETEDAKNLVHLEINRATLRISSTETIKTSTGWISKDRLNYISELLTSIEVYEITAAGLVIPVVWKNMSVIRKNDKHGLYAIQLEYAHAHYQFIETV